MRSTSSPTPTPASSPRAAGAASPSRARGGHSTFPAASAAVDRVLGIAGPVVEKMIADALPTPQTLRVLAEEVRKAASNRKAVAHPELADPDTYWRLAAFPQVASLVRQLRSVLVEVAGELAPVVEGAKIDFDLWLRASVASGSPLRRTDAAASRDAVIDAIAEKCGELHSIIASVDRLVPASTPLDALRVELATMRRKRVDDAMRRTGDSAAVAEAKLRQEPPYRHQDLLLDGYAMVEGALRADIAEMVAQLTAPIFGLGERMVFSYEEVVASIDGVNFDATARPGAR